MLQITTGEKAGVDEELFARGPVVKRQGTAEIAAEDKELTEVEVSFDELLDIQNSVRLYLEVRLFKDLPRCTIEDGFVTL